MARIPPRSPTPHPGDGSSSEEAERNAEELARSRLTITLNSLLDPYVLLNAVRGESGRIIDVEYRDANAAALAYMGRSRKALIGSRLLESYPRHSHTGLFDVYAHVIETGDPLIVNDFAVASEIKQGDRLFDMRGVKVGDGLSVTWRDVTERHELAERYRLLAENASDIVVQTTPGGEITWVSPSVMPELGWRPEDVIGRFLGGVTHPDEGLASDDWERVLDEEGRGTFEVRLRDAAGHYHYYAATAHNILDPAGELTSRVASLRKVDREVAARDALVNERDLLRAILQTALDPQVLLRAIRDEHGAIIDFEFTEANDAACTYNGMRREDLIGRRVLELMPGHQTAGLIDLYAHAIESGEPIVKNDVTYFSELSGKVEHSDVRGVRVGDLLSYTWHDLTTRREIQSRYQLLAENATDVVILADLEFRWQWVSPSITEVLGWRPEDVEGHLMWEYLHPEDHERISQSLPDANGRYGANEMRYLKSDGTYLWMSGRARLTYDDDGQPAGRVATLRDTSAEVTAHQDLQDSQERFRLLAENASDVVYQVNMDSEVLWISASVEKVLGRRPEDVVGTHAYDLVAVEDRPLIMEQRELVKRGDSISLPRLRYRRADGELLWMGLEAHPLRNARGEVTGAVVAVRNRHAEVLAERAATMLASGTRALVHIDDEQRLFEETCRIAEEAGYAFAWYGRKVHDEPRSVVKVASSPKARGYLDRISVTWAEDDPQGQGPTGRAVRLGHTVLTRDFRTDVHFGPWLQATLDSDVRSSLALPVWIGDGIDGSLQVYARDADGFDEGSIEVLESLAEELGFGLKQIRDRHQLVEAVTEQTLLISAVNQTGDGIVITDPDSVILYANPAAVRTSGYSRDELVGANPRIFQSGLYGPDFYREMWRDLVAGTAWHGVLFNKRKNGELYEEDVSISPIRDERGKLIAYVAVKHDLTTERKREQDSSGIVELMGQLGESNSLEIAADQFCRGVTSVLDIDAALVLINGSRGLMPIAISGSTLVDVRGGQPIMPDRADILFEMSSGPMRIALTPESWPVNADLVASAVRDGFHSIVAVPIRWRGDMVGILGLATKSTEASAIDESRYPYFQELGAYAGTLFGAHAHRYEQDAETKVRVRRIIENREFRPVFQPIVDLATGEPVGYEALTRFDDGVPPDQRFEEAHQVHLGSELECVCAAAALEAARTLPEGRFIDLNFSPSTLLNRSARQVVSRGLLDSPTRPLIIEITEHARIDDYAAVRRALDECGDCRVAVDDAGVGYTSLSHIIELRPDYVKIDISLVRDIDKDQARQAMVAGLCHYAAISGTTMVAEGVESAGEADMLRELGVSLGTGRMLAQGFHFGHPAPAT